MLASVASALLAGLVVEALRCGRAWAILRVGRLIAILPLPRWELASLRILARLLLPVTTLRITGTC